MTFEVNLPRCNGVSKRGADPSFIFPPLQTIKTRQFPMWSLERGIKGVRLRKALKINIYKLYLIIEGLLHYKYRGSPKNTLIEG
jgi:hypothetical protein